MSTPEEMIIQLVGVVLGFSFLLSIEYLINAYKAKRERALEKQLRLALPPVAMRKPNRSYFSYLPYIKQDCLTDWVDGWTAPENNPHIKNKYYLPYSQQGIDFPFDLHPKTQAHVAARTYWESQDENHEKWSAHKALVHAINNFKCEYCDETNGLHCHEVWHFEQRDIVENDEEIQAYALVNNVSYETARRIQLDAPKPWLQVWKSSQTLCPFHHKVKHIDQHMEEVELFYTLLTEYARLNNISMLCARKIHLEQALKERYELDTRKYDLDLSFAPGESNHIKIWENTKFLKFLQEQKKGVHNDE